MIVYFHPDYNTKHFDKACKKYKVKTESFKRGKRMVIRLTYDLSIMSIAAAVDFGTRLQGTLVYNQKEFLHELRPHK